MILESPGAYFLHLGYLNIKWYGIFLVLGFLLAAAAALVRTKVWGLTQEQVALGSFICLIGGMIGARLYYVLIRLTYFLEHPSKILAFNEGGLTIHGCLIGVGIAVYLYSKFAHIPITNLLDCASCVLPLAQATWRWGNFFNSEAFGAPLSSALIGVYIPPQFRPSIYQEHSYFHATFLYESVWNLTLFVVLYFGLSSKLRKHPGLTTCLYIILYSIGRLLIEPIRVDGITYGYINVPIAASLVAILISSSLIILIFKRSSHEQA